MATEAEEIAAVLREQAKYYDRLAPQYAAWVKSFLHRGVPDDIMRDWRSDWEMVDVNVAQLVAGRRCLADIGCGLSRFPAPTPSQRMILVDRSARMLDQARSRHPGRGVALVCADVLHLPFASESFDGILCAQVLSHLPDQLCRAALTELHRVLAPRGRLLVVDALSPFPSRVARHGQVQFRRINKSRAYRVFKIYRKPAELARWLPPGKVRVQGNRSFLFCLTWETG